MASLVLLIWTVEKNQLWFILQFLSSGLLDPRPLLDGRFGTMVKPQTPTGHFRVRGRVRRLKALVRTFVGGTASRALDLLYPGFCRECMTLLSGPEPFCRRCRSEIRLLGSTCPRCGQPVAVARDRGCGCCTGRVFHHDRVVSVAEYSGPWRTAVLRFKYFGDHGLRRDLAAALTRVYRDRLSFSAPGALVPVPGHPLRNILRGRDPVEELASDVARHTGLPLRMFLRRKRWIASQTSLPRRKRLLNPRGAYQVRWIHRRRRASLPDTVLLLDDVFTTGATASECARALKESGVRTVLVLVAACSLDG